MRKQENVSIKKKGGSESPYDPALRIAVAREYLLGSLGYVRLARKYGIGSANTVKSCVKWYQQNYSTDNADATIPPPEQPIQPDPPGVKQISEAADLRRQLEDSKLHIAALQTLIAVASKEMGIDITKNAEAKQSKS